MAQTPSKGTGLLYGLGYADLYDKSQSDQAQTRKDLGNIMQGVTKSTSFDPYTVTSGLGTAEGGPTGLTYSLSPEQEALAGQLTGDARAMFAGGAVDPREREQEVYNRMLQTAQPERKRSMAQLNQSLWNRGRGDMSTNLYGASPEQLAYFKAIEEQNAGMLTDAMDFTMKEQDALINRGQTTLDSSYKPYDNLYSGTKYGIDNKQLSEEASLERASLMSQLGLGQMTSDINYNNINTRMLQDLYTQGAETAGGWLDRGLDYVGDLYNDWGNGGQGSSPVTIQA